MAKTISVQKVVDWVRTQVKLIPIAGVGGFSDEPALTTANNIQQVLLAPPLAWRWNRKTAQVTTVAGTQDYVQAITDLGWIEKAVGKKGTDSFELEVKSVLPNETRQDRPFQIAAQLESDANVTFRLFPAPNDVYTVDIIYQIAAPLITVLTGFWAIPDNLAYLYRLGFRAEALKNTEKQTGDNEYVLFLNLAAAAARGFAKEPVLLPNPDNEPVIQPTVAEQTQVRK